MDPQASLTQGLFGPQATEDLPDRVDRRRPLRRRARPRPDGPDPAHRVRADQPGPRVERARRLQRPQRPRRPARSSSRSGGSSRKPGATYDIALIDCPPNLSLCSWAALLASDSVVVPVQAEDYGAQGIVYIQRAFDLALAHHNPRLRLAGIWSRCSTSRWGSTRPTTTSCGRSTATRSSGRPSPWPRISRKPSPPASRSAIVQAEVGGEPRRSRRSPTSCSSGPRRPGLAPCRVPLPGPSGRAERPGDRGRGRPRRRAVVQEVAR